MENLAQNNSNIENAIFRFFSPSLRTDKDPYLAYQEFRELGPIFRAPVPGDPWILSHYSSVYDALREKRLGHNSKATSSACPMHKIENDFAKMQEHWIFQQDPPEHTRIRAVLNKALSPKLIRTLQETVTKLAEELTDNCREKGEFDLISEIASPLPVKMIANLLGVSEADSKQFFEWTVAIARTLDPNFTDPSYVKAANDAAVGLTQYFKKHISSNRNIDSEYMLSSLIKAYENGDIKSEEELISTSVMLFVAGSETTMNLIGNGILALLKHPDQFSKLKEKPELVNSAIEELLRYDNSSQLTIRQALCDFEFYGEQLKQGELLLLLLGSANRDPQKFVNPDVLDIERAENRHLSFGYGIHFCLGAPLARLEAQILLPMILRKMPNLKLVSATEKWRDYITLRGLEELKLSTLE